MRPGTTTTDLPSEFWIKIFIDDSLRCCACCSDHFMQHRSLTLLSISTSLCS